MNYLLLGIAVAILGGQAFGRERPDLVPGSRYTSARGAALGDAFIPLADDGASALFYNPAALARLRSTHFEPLNLGMQANSDFLSMVDRNAYKVASLSGYQPTYGTKPALFPGIGASLFPNFYTRGLAFGVLAQNRLTANSPDGSSTHYRSSYQLIPTVGAGLRLASGVFRIGYSLQWINQASGDLTVPAGTDPLGYNRGLAQGSAFSHNIGMALTLPVEYLPSFNLVARNVLGAKYRDFSLYHFTPNPAGLPPDEEMTIDAAVSLQSKIATGAYFNTVFEYRDVTGRSGVSWLGRAAVGTEFSFRDQFFLRGGWGEGYLHAGIGLRRKTAELNLAWYCEEFGDGYRVQGDRRYMIQYQFRAF